nr:cache domain-containing protein [Campylobacter sp.]
MQKIWFKIVSKLAIVLIFGFCVVSSLIYNQNHNDMVKLYKVGVENTLNPAFLYVREYAKTRLDSIDEVALNMANAGIDDYTATASLKSAFPYTPFDALYIGYADDGRLIKTDDISKNNPYTLNMPNNKFDSRTRAWFSGAANTGQHGISTPYIDITTKNLQISFYSPIKVGGKIAAVVSSNVFLTTFQKDISDLKSPDSNIFIIDSYGNTIAHTDEQFIMSEDEAYNKTIAGLRQAVKNGKKENEYKIGSNEYDAFCLIDEYSDWTVCQTSLKSVISDKTSQSLIMQAILSIIFMSVIIIALIYFVKRELRPIDILSTGLVKFFSYLNYETKEPPVIVVNSKDELGMAAEMINANISKTKA